MSSALIRVEDNSKNNKEEEFEVSVTPYTSSSAGHASTRCSNLTGQIEEVLECHAFHVIIIILVLIDLAVVTAQLLIDLDIVVIHDEAKKVQLEHGLHFSSIAILTVFLCEVIVKIYIFRMRFFKDCFEVFDGAVVTISFILDLIPSVGATAAELIIVGRLWRVARIINGIILSLNTAKEGELVSLKEDNEKLKKEVEELKLTIEKLKKP